MASNVCELAAVRHVLVSQSKQKLCECVSFLAVVVTYGFQTDDGLEGRVRGHLHAHKAFMDRLGCVCQLEVSAGSFIFLYKNEA